VQGQRPDAVCQAVEHALARARGEPDAWPTFQEALGQLLGEDMPKNRTMQTEGSAAAAIVTVAEP